LILLLCPNTIGVLFGLGELHVAGENRNWVRESLLGTSLGCVRSTATRIQSSCFPNQRDPPTRPHNLPSMAKDRPDKSSLALSRPKRQSSGLNADSNVPVYSPPSLENHIGLRGSGNRAFPSCTAGTMSPRNQPARPSHEAQPTKQNALRGL
jgi:hypothetical protein